ncbi:MAG: hypothetical protein ACUVRS_01540 [Armatimonadota bacterium]
MAIRKILLIIAILVTIVGLSQLAFVRWWVEHLPRWIESPSFYIWGLVPLLFGVVLLIGILERVVGQRLLLTVVSVISIIGGATIVAQPKFSKDAVHALFSNRSYSIQLLVVAMGGIVRTLIGVIILWALARPETISNRPPTGGPNSLEQ